METVKVFISLPMRGKSNEEISREREKLTAIVKQKFDKEVEVIDSFFKDAPVQANALWFLGKSLQKLSEADVAIFAKGWEEARGCRIEHECCKQYGIKTIELRRKYI